MNIRHVCWIGLAMAALTACGSKKQGEPDKGERPAGSATQGSAATVVAGADLFTGTSVTLPTPAAKLHLGMTEAEAKAAAPEIFAAKYGYEVPGTKQKYDSVKIAVQIDKDRLWNIRAELLDSQDAAKAYLTKKWGEPIARKNSIGTPEYYWNAPAAGLRAKLEQTASKSTVYFSGMMQRDQLLGADPKHFAFDDPPLIGAPAADAVKILAAHQSYPPMPAADDPGRITIQFLPTENAFEVGSSVDLRIKNGKVTGYTLGFSGDGKDIDALAAKLETVFGKGKLDDQKLYTDYPGPPKAKAELRRDAGFSSTVWVGDHAK